MTLLHLPPGSPELNPTENIWQCLRQNNLSNRVFPDYDAVVEASASAWNKLVNDPGRITSISMRNLGSSRSRSVKFGITPVSYSPWGE